MSISPLIAEAGAPTAATARGAAPRRRAGEPDRVHVVVLGHVDHGKSTFIGRLLYDTNSLAQGKVEAVQRAAAAEGQPFEFAFLLDALLEEQEQNITIDTTRIPFSSFTRDYLIIDAPGHTEFLKNMVTGAASASVALLLLDAHAGLQAQTRRHAFLLSLLGVREVLVLVNKMDLVNWSETVFREREAAIRQYLAQLKVTPRAVLPLAAKLGENVAARSAALGWWTGPTVLEALDAVPGTPSRAEQPLRFGVQDVYRWEDRRILAGRVESGTLRVGDQLLFSPGGKSSRVVSIERWNVPEAAQGRPAEADESIGITLADPIFVERGALASRLDAPPYEQKQWRARVFWLSEEPLVQGRLYPVRIGAQEASVEVAQIERVVDATNLEEIALPTGQAPAVRRHEVADVLFRARRAVAFDAAEALAQTGRFVIYTGSRPAGGGIVLPGNYYSRSPGRTDDRLLWSAAEITPTDRAERNGHRGLVLWLTGLSGSGKTTLARAAERELFHAGRQVYVLDGDNLRHGLSAGLGFERSDRTENIRRTAEAAKLLADAGLIVLVSLISPFAGDRQKARQIFPAGQFYEVYINAPFEVCAARDPKGLYARAKAGQILHFTGLSSPYEAPSSPDLEIRTYEMPEDEALRRLLDFIGPRLALERAEAGTALAGVEAEGI